jgi:hypothetical protein
VRMSEPDSRRWVAKLWRSVCGLTRFGMPDFRAASLIALRTELSSAWCRRTVPLLGSALSEAEGNTYCQTQGRIEGTGESKGRN